MKKFLLLIFALSLLVACKNDSKEQEQKQITSSAKIETKTNVKYPVDLQEVFTAHGGIEQWNKMNTLKFSIPKSEKNLESQTIDLKNRYTFIENDDFSMGYDGGEVWVQDSITDYKGDAGFYHNLMFYFYSMPFVLGDKGLNYQSIEALKYKDSVYPGVKITFNDGIGASPKDEYYLYYDPRTKKMAWLGYTVTYRTGEPSDKVNLIKYSEWKETNGLVLPRTIAWYNYENGTIGEMRNEVSFEDTRITKNKLDREFFNMPEGARIFKASKE